MPADNLLNGILADFTNAATAYYPQLMIYAVGILASITLLQVAYLGAQAALARNVMGILDILIMGIIRIAIVYAVMAHTMEWGTAVIDSGKAVGAGVSGLSPNVLTPSGIYDLGLTLVGDFWRARSWGMWLNPIDDAAFVVVVLMVWLTWAASACIYLWLLIECVWTVAVGPIQLSFSTFEVTWPIIYAWGQRLLSLAVKVAVMLLVLAIGTRLVDGWINDLNGLGAAINDHRVYYATVALIESIIFASMVWILPNQAASIVRTHLGGSGRINESESAASGSVETARAVAGGAAIAAGGNDTQLASYVQRKLSS